MGSVSEADNILAQLEQGQYGTITNNVTRTAADITPTFYDKEPKGYELHSISKLWKKGFVETVGGEQSDSVSEYQEAQNELLKLYVAAAVQHPNPCLTREDWDFLQVEGEEYFVESGQAECEHDRKVRYAILVSNICNAVLVVAQLYAFVTSYSLALLAVFLDAVLDMISGLVVLFTWTMREKTDTFKYPVGRSRLEPLGVIGMACLMTAATLVTLEQSLTALLIRETDFSGLTVSAGTILLTALVVKFSLFQYCKRIDDPSVQALANDHFNDCFGNSLGICTALVAQHVAWWVDPIGGIFISCIIIRNWTLLTLEHCDQLLGKAADSKFISLVTFMACNHHPDVTLIDSILAYHVGTGIYVEVDIVLAADMPLHQAHDIGESLQSRIEKLDGVERAFVHIDTEVHHSKTIEHKVL